MNEPTVGVVTRWARWTVVGALGLAVQTTVLICLLRFTGLPYLLATFLAVASAIVHNFLWHERWTWAGRACGGPIRRVKRFLGFSGISAAVSMVGTVGVTAAYVQCLNLPVPVANILAVASLGTLNFVAARQLLFLDSEPKVASGGRS